MATLPMPQSEERAETYYIVRLQLSPEGRRAAWDKFHDEYSLDSALIRPRIVEAYVDEAFSVAFAIVAAPTKIQFDELVSGWKEFGGLSHRTATTHEEASSLLAASAQRPLIELSVAVVRAQRTKTG